MLLRIEFWLSNAMVRHEDSWTQSLPHIPLTRASPNLPSISSLIAHTRASARSGERPGPT